MRRNKSACWPNFSTLTSLLYALKNESINVTCCFQKVRTKTRIPQFVLYGREMTSKFSQDQQKENNLMKC